MDSILNQTYKNIEVIIVDDGSSDNTGVLCDEYAAKYTFIKVIHTKNGGLSVARNVGLDNATGEYIVFIDPDDFVSVELIEKAYNYSKDNDCDLIIFGRYNYYTNKSSEKIEHSNKTQILPKDTIMQKLFDDTIGSQAWEKFYKKELWNNIRFIPGRVYAEDVAIMHLVFNNAQKIGVIAEPLYYYFINDSTLTTSYRPFKWMSTYLAFKERLEFAEDKYPLMTEKLRADTINFARLTYDNYILKKEECDKPYMDEIINRLKNNTHFIKKTTQMRLHNKLIIFYYLLFPHLYINTIGYIHRMYYYFNPNMFR